MPRMGGLDVLEWLKTHESCRVIPVMVLTSSAQEQDITRAYQLGANSYMVKPNNLTGLVDLVKLAFRFWTACNLPAVPKNC
jgi:two-component system response regulator